MGGVINKVFPLKKPISNQEITKQLYAKNVELASTNKTLSLLRTIDALVLEPHTSIRMVCEHISQAIAQSADFPFVGLLTKSSRSRDEVTLYGASGASLLGTTNPIIFSRPIHIALDKPWFETYTSSTYLSLENRSNSSLAGIVGSSVEEIKTLLNRIPLKTLYVVKLQARRRVVGLLVVGFEIPVAQLTQDDTTLLDRVTDSIGVALDNKLLFEENQSVLRQLRETNAKLKALDEAKDDFISMASHQLRTPLTSVKGYISLVLEGDAGGLTKVQQRMLEQAFNSSQRMVYLIADLLNVSRLKTGKFVIETKPVNLADIVNEEIAQLREAAKSRQLTLEYTRPGDYPVLMLDETKIRQVIMNFVDNAIYYTPSGGTVRVELIDKPLSVEFKVVDNGLGVPKAEQPHLFTKFYRAANARKARPDGTGLGLFMAKKVIIAQNGALIFNSVEGKGSTFGFSFAKPAVAVEPDQAGIVVDTGKSKTASVPHIPVKR